MALIAKPPTRDSAAHEQCGLDSIEALPYLAYRTSLTAYGTDIFRVLVAIMQRLSESDAV